MNRRRFAQTLGLGSIAGLARPGVAGAVKLEIDQAPFQTTLVGVVHGVSRYHRLPHSPAMLFGGTGHAFLVNISKTIEQSTPYVWHRAGFIRNLANLGMGMEDLGFYSAETSAEDRARVEATIRRALDVGIPVSMVNLEHQLVTGYDEVGFDTSAPWPANPTFPPRRLTFGTWQELGATIHLNFYAHPRTPVVDSRRLVAASLEYAIDLEENPENHTIFPWTSVGSGAYANWADGLDEHHSRHGHFWNASVWGECRRFAGRYFGELAHHDFIADDRRARGYAGDLATNFEAMANAFGRLGDRLVPLRDKHLALAQITDLERASLSKMRRLARQIAG